LSPECVDSLLLAGADIHAPSPSGKTALQYACEHQKAEVVKRLLEAGADPAAEDDSGAPSLHTEGKRDAELLPLLLGTGVVDINKVIGKSGKTPLLARLEKYASIGQALTLLEYKPDVNISDIRGDGPLHYAFAAVFYGVNDKIHRRVIDTLISLGANPNAVNNEGNTPLHTMNSERGPFVSRLLNAGADLEARNHDGQTPLFKHANRDKGCLQTLIDLGANLDTRDSDGRTLLHRCCNDTDRLNYLISLGLDPFAVDYKDNSLLMEVAAIEHDDKQPAIMKHLISLGLDIDLPNHRGRTTLHVLCARAQLLYSPSLTEEHNLDYVLGVCKNLNPSDYYGVRPLHLAATISEPSVVKLLNAGADMFKVTHEGMSVLHIAARGRQANIVALFCSRLAELETKARTAFVNQQNMKGETALHYACRSGRPETVQALLEAGADPTILDSGKKGSSPFMACAQFEAEDQLWSSHKRESHIDCLHAAGVLVSDHERPFFNPRIRMRVAVSEIRSTIQFVWMRLWIYLFAMEPSPSVMIVFKMRFAMPFPIDMSTLWTASHGCNLVFPT
jgi:ankyrin repeat protein